MSFPPWAVGLAAGFFVLLPGARTIGGPPAPIELQGDGSWHAFSPDGHLLATIVYLGPERRLLRLRDVATGAVLSETDPGSESPTFLTFSQDSRRLALVDWTRLLRGPHFVIRLWEVGTGNRLLNLRPLRLDPSLCWGKGIHRCAFSPDGKTLAAATGADVVYLWETETGQLRRRFQGGVAVGFSGDGRTLIAVTHDGLVRRFAFPACQLIGPDETVPRSDFLYVTAVAFSRDGERVAMCDNWTVVVKDVRTGRIRCRVSTCPDIILSARFSPDAKTLAIDTEEATHLLDPETGRDRERLKSADGCVDFLADGKYLACYGAKSIVFRDATALFAHPEKAPDPPRICPPGAPLQAELVARQATYILDLEGGTPTELSSRIHFGKDDPGPTPLDLVLKLRNTGKTPLKLRDLEGRPTLYLAGPGAINEDAWTRQTGVGAGRGGPEEKPRTLAPGQICDLAITELRGGIISRWVLPGEYRIAGYHRIAVSPAPQGADDAGDGFGYVTLQIAPLKVQVKVGKHRHPPWVDDRPLPALKLAPPGTVIVPRPDDGSESTRNKLAMPIDLFKGIDRGTPLQETLSFLADRYDLTFHVDEMAFKKKGKPIVGNEATHITRVKQVSLRAVLQILLAPLAADVEVREGTIWIVPLAKSQSLADRLPRSPRWLREKMEMKVCLPRGMYDRQPLADALEFLRDYYDFASYTDGDAFERTGVKDVGSRLVKLKPQKEDASLGQALQELLDQAGARFVLRDGLVFVIPAVRK